MQLPFVLFLDDYICEPGYTENKYPVRVTNVQVETERRAKGKLRPKTIGHVDIGVAAQN